ncbi:hypothetical protein Tco_1093946, partial [Tanacetum coccineum]
GSQLTLLHSKELASPGSNSSWLSIHLVVYNEELAIPEQTAIGKGISNPLMAGSLSKTTKPTRLISWQCKKQTIMVNSTTEAEYVAAANYCGVIKYPVAHSRTKHIEIRFHFIRDCYEKRLIEVIKIHTDSNVADLLTKGFDVTRFHFLVFWMTAKSKTVNNTSYIDATVAGKPVTISEASIRSDLIFDDADGVDSLNSQAIFNNIQLMGPSPSIVVPDSNPEGSGGNHGGQSSNDISLSGNEDGLTLQSVYDLCVSLCKQVTAQAKEIQALKAQGRKSIKSFKGEPSVHKDPAFDDLDDIMDDAMDYMEFKDAQDEGRTSSMVVEEKESADKEVSIEALVSTVKPNEGTDKRNEGTDKQDGGTDSTKVSTNRQGEDTADQNEGKNAT